MSDSSRSRSRSSGPVLPPTIDYNQSFSPSGRFYSSSFSSPASASGTASSSTFSTQSHLLGTSPQACSVRFAIDPPISPSRSISAIDSRDPIIRSSFSASGHGRTCMCSPTTHPGSFRCSLHKDLNRLPAALISSRLNARRSAMTNSLVRISTVEGELVKRALSALIRPSSHHQRRREDFHPRPSRLSIMSKAINL